MKTYSKRINNIELRSVSSNDIVRFLEIVKWFPNKYYGHEDEYVKYGNYYVPRNGESYNIHESCFKNKESCFTVASISIDDNPEIRPININNLTDDEILIYNDLIKVGVDFAKTIKNNYKFKFVWLQ